MKTTFLIVLVLLITKSSMAQSVIISDLNSLHDQYILEKSKRGTLIPEQYAAIQGSPYLDEAFRTGEIIINDSTHFEKIPMRYNIFSGKMEFQNTVNQILEIETGGNHFQFIIGDQEFVTTNFIDKGREEKGILELLVKGSIQLYRKYNIVFKEQIPVRGYQQGRPNRFVRKADTFLISLEKDIPETVYSKKDLKNLLKPINQDVEEYLKINRMKIKSAESLAKLVVFHNNLLKKEFTTK